MKSLASSSPRLFRIRTMLMLLLSFGLSAVPIVQVAHAQTTTTITMVSEPGDVAIDNAGHKHRAVLTYGHYGCNGVDADGYCSGGSWSRIPGAHWIWTRQLVTQAQAINGTPWMTFTKSFTIPENAVHVTGQIQIAADDVYELYLNGVPVGSRGDTGIVSSFDLTPLHLGNNTLKIRVLGLPEGPTFTPYTNPAGLIYQASVSFSHGSAISV